MSNFDPLHAYKYGKKNEDYDRNFEAIFGKKEIKHGVEKPEEEKFEVKYVHNEMVEVIVKPRDLTPEEERKVFAREIVQPFDKNGKVNHEFYKQYGQKAVDNAIKFRNQINGVK
jgi:hypothetical protein